MCSNENIELHPEALSWLLLPPGNYIVGHIIGKERESKYIHSNNIRLFENEASSRFVLQKDGEFVSGLQITKLPDNNGIITNVYTKPSCRGNRYAGLLLKKSLEHFNNVLHSPRLTEDGERWANKNKTGVDNG